MQPDHRWDWNSKVLFFLNVSFYIAHDPTFFSPALTLKDVSTSPQLVSAFLRNKSHGLASRGRDVWAGAPGHNPDTPWDYADQARPPWHHPWPFLGSPDWQSHGVPGIENLCVCDISADVRTSATRTETETETRSLGGVRLARAGALPDEVTWSCCLGHSSKAGTWDPHPGWHLSTSWHTTVE